MTEKIIKELASQTGNRRSFVTKLGVAGAVMGVAAASKGVAQTTITDADIEKALDGYPDKKKDYPERSRLALQAVIEDFRDKRAAGKISDDMLAQAAATAAAARAATLPGNGKTSQDENAGPKIMEDAGMVTIKLH